MSATISFSSVSCSGFFEQMNLELEEGATAVLLTSREEESNAVLRLITGMSRPSAGSVRICGQSPGDLPGAQLYQFRRTLGILPAGGGLISNLKMWENIMLPLLFSSGAISPEASEEATRYLNRLNYAGRLMALPAHLSLPEKRVAAFVRAAIQHPPIMVYCNTFDGISDRVRETMIPVMTEFHLASPGRTSLFLTSSPDVARALPVGQTFTIHTPPPTERTV